MNIINKKMTLETLNRANSVKKTIDKLESNISRIHKFFSKKENLTPDEIEELIQIAMANTDYTLNVFKRELDEL